MGMKCLPPIALSLLALTAFSLAAEMPKRFDVSTVKRNVDEIRRASPGISQSRGQVIATKATMTEFAAVIARQVGEKRNRSHRAWRRL